MKKKFSVAIILLFISAVLLVVFLSKKTANMEVKDAVEVEYDKIKSVYGEEGYLGPMEQSVMRLSDEMLIKLNPGTEKNKKSANWIGGRYNVDEVNDIYDARSVVYSVSHLLGITPDENTFLYGQKDWNANGDIYRFVQFYKGVMVPDGYVVVKVDNYGNTEYLYNQCKTEEEMGIKSTRPKVKEKKILALFEKEYKLYTPKTQALYIRSGPNKKLKLMWQLSADSPSDRTVFFYYDANTGKEIIYDREKHQEELELAVQESQDERNLIPEPARTILREADYADEFVKHDTITYEQLMKWNKEKDPVMLEERNAGIMTALYGRFTEGKIESEEDAIKAAWSVGHWIGMNEKTDSFEVYDVDESETGKVYHLQQYYKGVMVENHTITVGTDSRGYGEYLESNHMKVWEIDVKPKSNVEKTMQDMYQDDYRIKKKQLIISELGLTWDVEVLYEGEEIDWWIEDETGEVYCDFNEMEEHICGTLLESEE